MFSTTSRFVLIKHILFSFKSAQELIALRVMNHRALKGVFGKAGIVVFQVTWYSFLPVGSYGFKTSAGDSEGSDSFI